MTLRAESRVRLTRIRLCHTTGCTARSTGRPKPHRRPHTHGTALTPRAHGTSLHATSLHAANRDLEWR